jgi:SAM-dependent methyltransferase
MEHINPGISILGNRFRRSTPKKRQYNSYYAANYVANLNPKTLLDIGAGDGTHTEFFASAGIQATWLDLGTSVYAVAQEKKNPDIHYIEGDFLSLNIVEKYECSWASHVLEHQANVGLFIRKLREVTVDNGWICITVPNPHQKLWGGHVTLWSPGLLAYNIVLTGVSLKSAVWINGTNEFSVVFRNQSCSLPSDLTLDSGDLEKLQELLPDELARDWNPWSIPMI